MIKRLFYTWIILSFNVYAKNITLKYEPSIEELVGTLDIQTFPGLPNYESIKNGDVIERHFYLKLNKLIDVIPGKGTNPIGESVIERNVGILQLAISVVSHLMVTTSFPLEITTAVVL